MIGKVLQRLFSSAMPPAPGAAARALVRAVGPYTMSDPLRLEMLYGLAREAVAHRVAGDVVECGVCNGGSAAILAAGIKDARERRLWLYDTFAGLPAPGDEDDATAKAFTGQLIGSVESVREVLKKVGFSPDRTVLRQGPFRETFKAALPDRIALLHIDADWYESVLLGLETFYPLVAEGGVVVLDDFGHWEGARKAFYAFCRAAGVEPLLERAGYTQAFWRKGQEHARDTSACYKSGIYRPRSE